MVLFGIIVFLLCNISGIWTHREEHFRENYNKFRDWTLAKSVEEYRRMEAAIFKGHMNETANPCEDFFEYACGNWGRRHPAAFNASFGNVVRPYHWHLLSDLLSESLTPREAEAHKKLKKFYASCMSRRTGIRWNPAEVNPDIGQWPTFEEYMINGELDWVSLAAQFHKYGVETFFNIKEDQDHLEVSIIKSVLKEDEDYNIAYRRSQLNTFGYLLDKSFMNDTTYEELFRFEKLLSKQTKAFEGKGGDYNGNIGAAISEIPSIDFNLYFSIVYGTKNYDNQIRLYLHNKAHFRTLRRLVAAANPRVVINYMIKKYLLTYIPLISAKNPDEDRFCAETTERVLEPAVTNLVYNRVIGVEGKRIIDDLARRMITEVTSMIRESRFLEQSDKVILLQQAKEYVFQFIGPAYIFNNTAVDDLLADLHIESDTYSLNLVNSLSFSRGLYFQTRKLMSPKELLYRTMKDLVLSFSRDRRRVQLSLAYLLPPNFHKYSPGFSRFGLTGSALGHEIMHGFDYHNFADSNGVIDGKWSNKFKREYPQRAECFNLRYSFKGVELGQSRKTQTIKEHSSNVVGRRLAVAAYKEWLRENSIPEHGLEDDLYAGLGLNNIQLFFLAQAQFSCESMRDEYYMDRTRNGVITHPSNIYHTNIKVSEFLRAFNCPQKHTVQCKYLD